MFAEIASQQTWKDKSYEIIGTSRNNFMYAGYGGVAQALDATASSESAVIKPDKAGRYVPAAVEPYEVDVETKHTLKITGGHANEVVTYGYDYALYVDGTAYAEYFLPGSNMGPTLFRLNSDGEWKPNPFTLSAKVALPSSNHIFKAKTNIKVNGVSANTESSKVLMVGPIDTPGPGPGGGL